MKFVVGKRSRVYIYNVQLVFKSWYEMIMVEEQNVENICILEMGNERNVIEEKEKELLEDQRRIINIKCLKSEREGSFKVVVVRKYSELESIRNKEMRKIVS